MNRSQARALVSRHLYAGFRQEPVSRNFVQNLLNHFDESKAAHWNTTYVKDAFKAHVQRYERLGTYTSPRSRSWTC